MSAQNDRTFALGIRTREVEVVGRPVNLRVVLDHDSVLNDGDARRGDLRIAVELCGREENIISLPVSGGRAGVDKRRRLSVNGAAGAVGIVVDFKRVEDLDFVCAEERENATQDGVGTLRTFPLS